MSSAYASSTQGNYQRLWEAFQAYCTHNGLVAAPATPATIVAYLGYLFERGTVRGGSIRPYLAAMAAKHHILGLRNPTADGQVAQTRQGFRARDARRASGPPQRSAPLPAAVTAHALSVALESSSHGKLQRFGLRALTFLLCSRPGSTRELQRQDLDFSSSPGAVGVQMRRYKYAETGVIPRLAIRVPIHGQNEPIGLLLHPLADAAAPSGYLFPGSGRAHVKPAPASLLAEAMSSALAATGALPPVGLKFTPRSLRSGSISSAYAVGLPPELIMRLSNYSDQKVVLKHYLDPQTRTSPEARLFFGRFMVRGILAGQPC